MLELQFIKNLPTHVPAKMNVYSTEEPRASEDAISEMVGKLNLPATAIREFRTVNNWTIAKHGKYSLGLNKLSGGLNFRDEERSQITLRRGEVLKTKFDIPESRLKDISRKFLNDTKLLKVDASEAKVGKITYLRTQGASVTGQMDPVQILDAGVIISREIDGFPVVGPGAHIMVNIDHDETVIAAQKIWRHRKESLGKFDVIKPDVAIGAFEKKLTSRGLKGPIKVLKADFGYFELGNDLLQKYLEPTYAFLYETKVGDFIYKSVEIISAIEKPRQKLEFGKRFPGEVGIKRG